MRSQPHMKTGLKVRKRMRIKTAFPPVLHLRMRNIPDGKGGIRRPWTGGWDILDGKVNTVRIVLFITFLRVIHRYIGEIGGVGHRSERE